MTRQILPLVLSAITVWMMWQAGNLKTVAWVVGLANQALWLAFIVMFGAWGLLPLCAALVVTYSRNLVKWRREQRRFDSVQEDRDEFERGLP